MYGSEEYDCSSSALLGGGFMTSQATPDAPNSIFSNSMVIPCPPSPSPPSKMAEVTIGELIGAVAEELVSLIPQLSGLGKKDQHVQEWYQLLLKIRDALKDNGEMKYRNYELLSWHEDLWTLVEDIQVAVADLRVVAKKRGILSRIEKALKPESSLKKELKIITRRIQHIYERKKFISLNKKKDINENTRTGSASGEPTLFGRNSEFEKIFDLIERRSNGNYGFEIISIVGMGGVGKTTLAQHVYNDDRAASFPIRAWCCVSIDFNLSLIHRSIIEQITGHCDIHDSSAMQEKLRGELKGKKFLIVLDDVWIESVHEFNALRAPFLTAEPGSMFIITTRDRAIAKRLAAGEERIIYLGVMSKEDCWSMFYSGLRLKANSTSNLVSIAKEICEKCEGLPLAIAVMKGMLSGIDDEAIWRDTQNELISGKVSDIHYILMLSYQNLSHQLKECFSFSTILPKDLLIEKKQIVDLWIYAGIIKCEDDARGRYLGGRCFDELVSRALLIPIDDHRYTLHSMMRLMGIKVAKEKYGIWEDEVGSWRKIKYLTIGKKMVDKALKNLKLFPEGIVLLKTLIIDGKDYNHRNQNQMNDIFLRLRHLRVLEMDGFRVSKISKYFWNMEQLRKIKIHNFRNLQKIPIFTKFSNLIEIDIACCSRLEGCLPSDLWRLKRLKKFSISMCEGLTGHIPQELEGLKTLKEFHIIGCINLTGHIPRELGELAGLESLSFEGCRGLTGPIPWELGGLKKLKSLSFCGCDGLTGLIPQELAGRFHQSW